MDNELETGINVEERITNLLHKSLVASLTTILTKLLLTLYYNNAITLVQLDKITKENE